jgi:hypothetical protein
LCMSSSFPTSRMPLPASSFDKLRTIRFLSLPLVGGDNGAGEIHGYWTGSKGNLHAGGVVLSANFFISAWGAASLAGSKMTAGTFPKTW